MIIRSGQLQFNSATKIDFENGKPIRCHFDLFNRDICRETRKYADTVLRKWIVDGLKSCGWNVEIGQFSLVEGCDYIAEIKVIENKDQVKENLEKRWLT